MITWRLKFVLDNHCMDGEIHLENDYMEDDYMEIEIPFEQLYMDAQIPLGYDYMEDE